MKLLQIKITGIALSAVLFSGMILTSCGPGHVGKEKKTAEYPAEFTLSKAELLDKIKGGWAGQAIGCTYGGPTEFRFRGTMIQDYQPIEWDAEKMIWNYENRPGLYDDLYMDLTFVEVFEKEGIDAPASSHAHAFANAGYQLWHANQAARYNILNGIDPPGSGYWENNPHADDIDFQIEADFAGLMNPGMVNSASRICDRVGHIMNYGDGWYGGVYVAAMYSLAFYSDDVVFVVKEALKIIPPESEFYRCINDVIHWCELYPDDWKRTWFETEKKWSSDIGCPKGVFDAFNIDAKINAAYIVIGMMYGKGDFGKTIDISARCGQDSDCNPASAGGILGTMIGYDSIPAYWKQGLDRVEDMDFKYTTSSLTDTYGMSFRHAIEMVNRNGGKVSENELTIPLDDPVPVKYEQAFEGHYPVKLIAVDGSRNRLMAEGAREFSFEFNGKGFVISGSAFKRPGVDLDRDLFINVFIDDKLSEEVKMPTRSMVRRLDIAWKFNLADGDHKVRILLKDPLKGYGVEVNKVIIYSPVPAT